MQRDTLVLGGVILAGLFFLSLSDLELPPRSTVLLAAADSATQLDAPPQQCNRDPAKGKLGPIGRPPPTKCVANGKIQEGKNARFFDSLVQVDDLGRTKVCDTPIPLNEKCEPTRAAIVEYCDTVRSNASGGNVNCRKISKEDSKSIDTVNKIADYLSDADKRRDYVARGIIEATQGSVTGATRVSSIRDSEGLLVPITDSEKVAQQLLGPTDRRIEGTQDALRALADFDPQDPQRLDTAKALVEKAEAAGLDPWNSVPTRLPTLLNGPRDVYRLIDEQGLQVNYYQRDSGVFAGDELIPPQNFDAAMAIRPPTYSDIDPNTGYRYRGIIPATFSTFSNSPGQETLPQSANFFAQSAQTVSNTYTATLNSLQSSLSGMLRWLRGW
ncbi:MAG: hypothetical protein AAB803_01800 [Patescibacteria group bacterium]